MNENYFYVIKTHHVANGRDYSDFDAIYPNYDAAIITIQKNSCDIACDGYCDWVTLWKGTYGCYPTLEMLELYKWNKELKKYERKEIKDYD